ncbi:hypothetical protein BD779DRAFT_291440 [Infundibulicybe gibba]|nr:hypothetical protein BD779DRAFT_291440 [Infundibulicybe gibba]
MRWLIFSLSVRPLLMTAGLSIHDWLIRSAISVPHMQLRHDGGHYGLPGLCPHPNFRGFLLRIPPPLGATDPPGRAVVDATYPNAVRR